jgi:hypothetical protein
LNRCIVVALNRCIVVALNRCIVVALNSHALNIIAIYMHCM